jgi:hypothetical protein
MTTPLEILAKALLGAAAFQQAAEAAPQAVLWCDAQSEFAPIIPALRTRLPQLLSLGEYHPPSRTGPALWIRAAAARQVRGVEWPEGEPPIIHLPGIAREVLRGAEECPHELSALVWFAVSGVFFGQPKQGRDWTMRGFLAAQGSPVGLTIPEDKPAREALARAATRLFVEPVSSLTGKRWDAVALDGLLVEDPIVGMLAWIDGTLTREADPVRFEAFSALATKQFSFDPRKKSRQDAAARLARREKAWGKVWSRFEQANGAYEGVVKLLGFEEPPQADLLDVPVAYPTENARREDNLRTALMALRDVPADKAAKIVVGLEKAHDWRRLTVWAKRGEARLAQALEHLAMVAGAAPLPCQDAEAMAAAYATEGWKIDAAALAALDIVRSGDDRAAVVAALRAIYLPWIDVAAVALQTLAVTGKVILAQPKKPKAPPHGAVLLFVDGLRMDLAQRLAGLLQARGASIKLAHRWSGFPTVTATCKPLASPAAALLTAGQPDTMLPNYEGKLAAKPVLMKAIEAAGWSCVTSLLRDRPIWQEIGQFDEDGHALGSKLAERIRDALEGVADDVMKLAQQGRRVRIVTDHGWLLMPEGLPHAPLTAGLTEPSGKANRVALLKDGAPTNYPRVPWSWDHAIQFVTPPGARAFYNGTEYAHGGISPQECVLPVLDVIAEVSAKPVALSANWRNLMLKVKVVGGAGLLADVRLGADTSGPSALIKGPKTLDDAGEASLGVDSDYEGRQVCIVIARPDSPDDVVAKLVTTAGA